MKRLDLSSDGIPFRSLSRSLSIPSRSRAEVQSSQGRVRGQYRDRQGIGP